LRIKEEKKNDWQSPVAVAKELHLLAPNFLPLWDDKIARAYDCYYNVHPDQRYVAFAYKMRALARQLQEHVPADFGRTFLKLIDEYNYAKYTKGWIQPMTATSQKPKTLLEAVRDSLAHARRYDPGDVVAPAAVLGTDADGHWRPLVGQ